VVVVGSLSVFHFVRRRGCVRSFHELAMHLRSTFLYASSVTPAPVLLDQTPTTQTGPLFMPMGRAVSCSLCHSCSTTTAAVAEHQAPRWTAAVTPATTLRAGVRLGVRHPRTAAKTQARLPRAAAGAHTTRLSSHGQGRARRQRVRVASGAPLGGLRRTRRRLGRLVALRVPSRTGQPTDHVARRARRRPRPPAVGRRAARP